MDWTLYWMIMLQVVIAIPALALVATLAVSLISGAYFTAKNRASADAYKELLEGRGKNA